MITIGRKDKIDLPELGFFNIDAKVDTGAYGSALHCHHVEVVERDGNPILSFKMFDPSHPEYDDKVLYFEDFSDKTVKSSSGQAEHRYTIKAKVVIFKKKRVVEFSLTDRKEMKYPVLLGRKFLRNRYVVDVQQVDISYNLKKSKL
ncbi:MAG: RimK/LysX family protein [Tunicatimonas sp.]|uniref:ATP-dependent zinc protease family protein n=1 Tax=Tunicatimonas sp. TaxID=1940096 RepID=UPI003C716881